MEAVEEALNVRDGLAPSLLTNDDMLAAIPALAPYAVWSLLDQKGTQEMMRGTLGDAAQLMNYEAAKSRLRSSRYLLDFRNGIRFELQVVTSDTMTGATLSAVLRGAALMGKSVGAPVEKAALGQTTISSDSGVLSIAYQASENQFAAVMNSALFRQVTQ